MANDFTKVLECCAENINFATINVSSPNTNKLRNLQHEGELKDLLSLINESKQKLIVPIPIFLKISPDLQFNQLEKIVNLAQKYKLSGIVT